MTRQKVLVDYLVVGSLVFVIGLIGLGLASFSVFADDETGGHVSVNVPVSCMLTGDEVEAHSKSILNGTNESEIGSTTLIASCNDDNGFALYTIGFTDNIEGKNVLTNSALGSGYDIVTGTSTSGSVSNWSMMVTPESDPTYSVSMQNGFDTYRTIPDEYTMVAKRESATDAGDGATGTNLTATYQTYVSRTQMAGNYSGQVKYVLVHPHDKARLGSQSCEAGNICYYSNAVVFTGEMGKQSVSNNESVTLYASNYKRDGYGFAGWSDVYDYTTNPDAHFYGPNQDITVPDNVEASGLSLYAVWIKSAGSMQTDITSVCNSLTIDPNDGTADLSTVSALTDDRDGNTYAIAKLADNKCWMIENLRLADKDSDGDDIILTSQNTHNPSLPITNDYGATYNYDLSNAVVSNHLSSPIDPTQTDWQDYWCVADGAWCTDQSKLVTNNTTLYINNTAQNYDIRSYVYSYGNYYNWYSATAGHGKIGSGDDSFVAPGDICPANWHLPRSGDKSHESTSDFWQLIVTGVNGGIKPEDYDSDSYSDYHGEPEGSTISNALRAYPNNFIYSGSVYGGWYAGYSGGYWSSYLLEYITALSMYLRNDYVSPGMYEYYEIYSGLPVRCVAGN